MNHLWRAARRRRRRDPSPSEAHTLRALHEALARADDSGDRDQALASTRSAIDTWLASGPLHLGAVHLLPYALGALGRRLHAAAAARFQAGDVAGARSLYEEELPMRRWVHRRVRWAPEPLHRLLSCLRDLGQSRLRCGDHDGARTCFAEALGRIGRRPRPLTRADAAYAAQVLCLAAEQACASGDLVRGRALAVEAVSELRGLLGAGKDHCLLPCAARLGSIMLEQDWDAPAADLHDAAMPAARALLAENHDDLRWRRLVCRMAGDASDACFCCGRRDEARELSREELSLARSCVALSGGAVEDRGQLADALAWAARLAEKAGEVALAGDLRDASQREESALPQEA